MVNPKGNPANMVHSPIEARTRGRNGGKKSGEVRRQKRAEREEAKKLADYGEDIGNMTIDELREMGFNFPTLQGIPGSTLVKKAIFLKQIQMALDGSNQSFEHYRDQIGEKPVEKQEIAMTVKSPSEMSRQELEEYLRNSMTDRP